MQLIAPLYDVALAKRERRLSVVCATSGDTGGAAAEALKGRDRVDSVRAAAEGPRLRCAASAS
jgi:threonine synthase